MLGIAKIITLLHAAVLAISSDVQAQSNIALSPTIVEATANTSEGSKNSFIIEQPMDAPNPLGDPIPITTPSNQPASSSNNNQNNDEMTNQSQSQTSDTSPGNNNAESLGHKFQNTILEANGMIYDIQAYPKADIPLIENPSEPQTIYSPNVNP